MCRTRGAVQLPDERPPGSVASYNPQAGITPEAGRLDTVSPEGIAAAKRRIDLRLVDAKKQFALVHSQTLAENAARGLNLSGVIVGAVHRLCDAEFQHRAEIAWNTIKDVIDSEGWTPSEAARQQIQALVQDALTIQSPDIEELYARACAGVPIPSEKLPGLADAKRHAIESAMADADIDLLGRKARRPPLIDELSAPRYQAARQHWLKALDLSLQDSPDLPNALKEACAAIESMAQIALAKPGTTVGDAVKELRSQQRLPVGADKILEGLYAFASASPGARHGSALPAHVDPSHWDFARTSAEGAIRLLLDIDAGK